MQGPSVLSGIALIRDWEISNDGNIGHAGIWQTCLGPMSKLFCVCVCYANVPPLSCTPSPRLNSFDVSHHWCPVFHMVNRVRTFLYLKHTGNRGLLFLPVVFTARYCPWVNWSLVGLNNSEEVTASILQIFQRRGKVRHWLPITVWTGRSWDLNPGIIKLWIALPFLISWCSCQALTTLDCGGVEGSGVTIAGVYYGCVDYHCICSIPVIRRTGQEAWRQELRSEPEKPSMRASNHAFASSMDIILYASLNEGRTLGACGKAAHIVCIY